VTSLKRPLGALVFAALAAFPIVASAAPPRSIDLPAQASYKGGTVPTAQAASLGLACNVVSTGAVNCYDTQTEALAAGDVGDSASAGLAASGGVVALAECSPPMTLYDGTSFTGSYLNIYGQSVWINLSGYSFSNRTSSWKTGCVGGYLANGTGGSGAQIGMPANNSQASMGTFNNLASSAKRCPC
jgi:hypothetical protein